MKSQIFQPELGQFLREMMGVLADGTMTTADKLDHGGKLIQERIGSGQVSLMLYDQESQQLKVVAASRPEIIGMVQNLSTKSISGFVCAHKKPLLIKNIATDHRFSRSRGRSYTTESLISVPLLSDKDRVLGVLNVADKKKSPTFNEDDLSTLLAYANWITPLMENLFIQDRLQGEKERYRQLARELELKQQELILASAERSELVQMVVHDFKSPLSAVISNLDLLNYLGPSTDQKPIINTALQGASKLLEMINEFLHLARVDEWQERGATLEPVALVPIIEAQIQRLLPLALEKEINIENHCTALVWILADPMLLGHLIQNLLSNALKYSPPQGIIRLNMDQWPSRRTADPTDMVLKFWIEDQGPGIADEDKELIFEKFTRVNTSLNQEVQGTGIGLFICQKIVTLFKGKIWVEDNDPCGSRFSVIFFVTTKNNA